MERRIEWIDALKGIGIIFVVFAHLSPNIMIETHIYSFHMFLFFFISGYLTKEQENKNKFISKRFKRLIIPYIIWNGFAIIVESFVNRSYQIKDALLDMFYLDNGYTEAASLVSWNTPVWFLIVLFEIEIIYVLLSRINNAALRAIITIAIIICGYFTQNRRLHFGIGIAPIGLSFYVAGNLAKKFDIAVKFEKLNKAEKAIILGLLLAVNIIFSNVLNIRISVVNSNYGNYFYAYIAGIAGILLYVGISILLPKFRLLKSLGCNTLYLLSTQYLWFRLGDSISKKYFNGYSLWRNRSTIKALIVTCGFFATSYAIIKILKKINKRKLNAWIGIN